MHRDIMMRLGFFKDDLFESIRAKDVIWIHAVSVGEARAAESLIRLIRQEWPKSRLVVSTVTSTGYEIVKKMLEKDEIVFYAPLDISFVVRKFLRHISPLLLIIFETEIWPNLIRLSKDYGCRVAVVNGRISDSSYAGYRRFRPFFEPIVRDVDLFCMQTEDAAFRVKELGAVAKNVKNTGNIKFDISADRKESLQVARLKNCFGDVSLLIAGSTHENEEELIIDVYKSLKKDFSRLRLLIAPRHINRVDQVRRIIRLRGFETVFFSNFRDLNNGVVVILDTIGDLNALYKYCEIAFVGGSLVKKGGHNPIEPALFAKPILHGSHMENFKEIRNIFIKEKASVEVKNAEGLEYELRRLLADGAERKRLGERAAGLLQNNKGAAGRTFEELRNVIHARA